MALPRSTSAPLASGLAARLKFSLALFHGCASYRGGKQPSWPGPPVALRGEDFFAEWRTLSAGAYRAARCAVAPPAAQ
eukprot:4052004-Pyramimonas_sp.AAC.1